MMNQISSCNINMEIEMKPLTPFWEFYLSCVIHVYKKWLFNTFDHLYIHFQKKHWRLFCLSLIHFIWGGESTSGRRSVPQGLVCFQGVCFWGESCLLGCLPPGGGGRPGTDTHRQLMQHSCNILVAFVTFIKSWIVAIHLQDLLQLANSIVNVSQIWR